MQHARAHDLIERAVQLPDVFNRQSMQLEIPKSVLLLEVPGATQARVTDVDGGDPAARLAKRIPGRLRSAATRHEDVQILPSRVCRPDQMEQRPAPLPVAVEIPVPVQTRQRRGIRSPLVEMANLFRCSFHQRFFWPLAVSLVIT